jgi:hypothetical protein
MYALVVDGIGATTDDGTTPGRIDLGSGQCRRSIRVRCAS